MSIVGCDLHARQQIIAMVDTEAGEFTETTLAHEDHAVREFYATLEGQHWDLFPNPVIPPYSASMAVNCCHVFLPR